MIYYYYYYIYDQIIDHTVYRSYWTEKLHNTYFNNLINNKSL